MAGFVVATIVSRRHLALARVTALSCRAHNPAVPFITLLSDEPDSRLLPENEPFQLVYLRDLQLDNALGLRFQYNEFELSYALTPFWIQHLLGLGYEGVIFLKQETMVLGSLAPEFEQLGTHSVLVTPHLLEPPQGEGAVERELNVLRAGVFNGGFIGFSSDDESRRVLAWWARKTRRHCFRAVEQGIHFEQRWLDFVPSLAPRALVLRDPGINIGHWNLPERRIRVIDGRVTADGVPCRIFRFSGYDPAQPDSVTRYNNLAVSAMGDAAEVFRTYQRMLEDAGHFEVQ